MKDKKNARFLTYVLLAAVLLTQSGCAAKQWFSSAGHRYQTRGVLFQVSPSAEGGGMIGVVHEEIPDFVDRDGNMIVMQAMPMTLRVRSGVSLSDWQAGDKAVLTIEQNWNRAPVLKVLRMERLPETTELALNGYSVEVQ